MDTDGVDVVAYEVVHAVLPNFDEVDYFLPSWSRSLHQSIILTNILIKAIDEAILPVRIVTVLKQAKEVSSWKAG